MFSVAVVEYLFTFSLTVASCKRILGSVISEPLAHVPFVLNWFFSAVYNNILNKL